MVHGKPVISAAKATLGYLEAQVRRCSADHGLRVSLGQTVTRESLRQEQFDALVVCSGAKPVTPDIPGTEMPHVVQGCPVTSFACQL